MGDAANGQHAALMDGVYRYQRHIYDLTRKYYLLGRDHLIGQLHPPEGGSILEIGCGTGRNLAFAGKCYPHARLFGADISSEMLRSAGEMLSRKGLHQRARIGQADATNFVCENPFDIASFDRVYFSYSLSMMPGWRKALFEAVAVLAPGGELHVVDFGQQESLPNCFGVCLNAWLKRFHVTPRAGLEQALREAANAVGGRLDYRPIYRDYARYGIVRRCDDAMPGLAPPLRIRHP